MFKVIGNRQDPKTMLSSKYLIALVGTEELAEKVVVAAIRADWFHVEIINEVYVPQGKGVSK